FYKFIQLMPFDEKKKQKIKYYAEQLRECVDSSVDINGLSDEEIDNAKKQNRDKVYHTEGIRFFDRNLQIKITQTLEELSDYHLHILKTGELETLLEEFGLPYKEKKEWVIEAIEKISSLKQEDIDKQSDVYKFVSKIIDGKIQTLK
ncbi:MAG: hypothetical protein LUH07_05465, partial [Lachnospiraceae bacterium]|nr:hypothetical protein [Lachnospiraceae bacterium]